MDVTLLQGGSPIVTHPHCCGPLQSARGPLRVKALRRRAPRTHETTPESTERAASTVTSTKSLSKISVSQSQYGFLEKNLFFPPKFLIELVESRLLDLEKLGER